MEYPPNENGDNVYETWRTALNNVVATLSSAMCLVGILFMATIFKTRKFTFNLYIISAILPDSLCNGVLGFSLFYEAFNDGAMPPFLCSWMCFHLLFYYLSNVYVNAVIAKEVYTLVLNSYRRKRTVPPTTRKVVAQVGIVYVSTGLASALFVAPVSWSVMDIDSEPICVSRFKNIYAGMAINILLSLPAFLCVLWVAYRIRKDRLLPRRGRTRVLALYFMRIIVIFVAFYCPILFLATYGFVVAPGPEDPVPILYFLSLQVLKILFPIQNIVTFQFLLQKEDILQAVRKHVSRITTCRRASHEAEAEVETSEWVLDDVYEDHLGGTDSTDGVRDTKYSVREEDANHPNDEEIVQQEKNSDDEDRLVTTV